MDDLIRKTLQSQLREQEHKNHRHLQTDPRSVGLLSWYARTMPQTRLKARMLGGQAETIRRLGANRQR
jgi:hypothetical protein